MKVACRILAIIFFFCSFMYLSGLATEIEGSINYVHFMFNASGKGCVFTYDAVGSYEKVGYSSQGSGAKLIMPFLDNQLKSPSPLLIPAQVCH